jgi:tetratricopeptide (TPR) repeat protein
MMNSIAATQNSFDRALGFLQSGDAALCADLCRSALDEFPRDSRMQCLLATALNRQQNFDDAEEVLCGVIDAHPEIPKAHFELGHALFGQGRGPEAVECFERVVELTPDKSIAHMDLSLAYSKVGRSKDARQALEESFRLDPGRKELLQAAEHHRAGRHEDAERIYRDILVRDPKNISAMRLLGSLAFDVGRYRIATKFLKQTVELAPRFFAAWTDLAQSLTKSHKFDEAEEAINQAIRLEPALPYPRMLLGTLLTKAGRYEDAIDAYKSALEKQPDHGGSLIGLGNLLKTIGRQDEAIRTYRDCVEKFPSFGEAYYSLANLKTFRFTDEEIANMEQHVENERLPEESRVNINFALGKAYEDRGEYGPAFACYQRGNDMRRMNESYDPVQTEVIHDRIIETFTQEYLDTNEGNGDPDPAPIFIVGLPRSGSTLIEQILASHTLVEGTHELADLGRVIGSINRQRPAGARYPEAFRQFDAERLRALGQKYLTSTQRHRTGLPHFTDKMPNNFPSIGMLHLILPNAKIINAHRHPLDSCMGSYKQLFFGGQAFTYDLIEIGEYYLEYRRMMDYWHQVLPGKVLDIRYEDMVADQEVQTRRLLDYCELPFEEECLRFYETDRAVNTASSEQVRQPIYSKSVNSWRRFEEHLAPLIEVLEPILMQLPAEDRPKTLN